MSAAPIAAAGPTGARPVTLLELVQAVVESCDDDREVVATILSLLDSGRVRLCGNFRGFPVDALR